MPAEPYVYLHCTQELGVLIMTLQGSELQGDNASHGLLAEMERALEEFSSRKVVVDFSNIQYISSVAFRPLLNLRRLVRERQGSLILCCLSEVVGDVFYTTRMAADQAGYASPFRIEKDVPTAIACLVKES